MLVIRRSQMDSLHRFAFACRVKQWAREFRAELPSETQCYSDIHLEKLLQASSTATQRYGFANDVLMREYLRVIIRTGAGTDGLPADPSERAVVEDSASSPRKDWIALLFSSLIGMWKRRTASLWPRLSRIARATPPLPISAHVR